MTREEAQAQTAALNRFKNKKLQTCGYCTGSGHQYAPMFGDPNLGYAVIGRCPNCKGQGQEPIGNPP